MAELAPRVEHCERRLDDLETRVSNAIGESLHSIDGRLIVLEQQYDFQRTRFESLSDRFDSLVERLGALSTLLTQHSERDSRENAVSLRAVLVAILTTVLGFGLSFAHTAGLF